MSVGVYLCCGNDRYPSFNILYNDVDKRNNCELKCDALKIDLAAFDYVLASPPCNYYSRANYRRDTSLYSLQTKHLLPDILRKLIKLQKPFIVENVRNCKLFKEIGLYDLPCFIYIIGRHTYWSNILIDNDIFQRQDFLNGGYVIKYDDMENKYHQGGFNVHQVFKRFLETIHSCAFTKIEFKESCGFKL